jgi:hypothetical protein
VSDKDDVEEAGPEARAAFARFLEVISTPEGRVSFSGDPDATLGEEAARNLPAELKGFAKALSVEELALLDRLSQRTTAAGLFSTEYGITLSHL